MQVLARIGIAILLTLPGVSAAAGSLEEAQDCFERNVPKRSSVQIVEFTAVDRIGGERISRAKIYAKKLDDGFRRLKMRFTKPLDMRDSEMLMIETDGANDIFLYTSELRKPKRVSGHGSGGSLFGTDFSYEDFERWQHLNRPGQTVRLEDSAVADRPAFVLETTPLPEAESSYETVVTFIDKATCLAIKTESYEPRHSLRKVLTADPEQFLQEGGIWVATQVLMQDIRDETHTRAVVEDIEVDREIADRIFQVSRMGLRRR